MASIINTNIASLNAQRALAMSQGSLATSMQRLSSGLRINSAKDDAAGLAISERFTTQIRGLNQAARNANDGISLSQTAEGALGEITNNLQRIRELAVQSANSTNSASDRAALNQEVQQRLAEIDRVAVQTTFNSQKILDGSFGNAMFQVGANVGDTITIGLATSMRQSAIGSIASVASTIDLRTLIEPNASPATTTSAALTPTDFAATPATAGSSTLVFSTATPLTNNENVVLNGVTFTFVDGGAGSAASEIVNSATSVTVSRDMTTAALTLAQSASAVVAGINVAKGNAQTSAALTTITASSDGVDTVTIDDTRVGTAGYAGRTLTSSASAAVTLSFTGIDGTAGKINVGGTEINLTTTIANVADLVSVINTGLDNAVPPNTAVRASATASGIQIVFTSTATGIGTAPPVVSGSIASVTNMLGAVTAVAGVDSRTLTVPDGGFSVAIGTKAAVNVAAGVYTTTQAFMDAVTTAIGGAGLASYDLATGLMTLSSAEDITIAGNTGLSALGLAPATVAGGSLETVNVLTVAASNDAIQRMDSGLTTVSNLRSIFGAIQNRFESVIANLTTSAENLTASRSRILDADFAQETANLSRAQILQQAGTAMVAQANQLPQTVLSLLRQ